MADASLLIGRLCGQHRRTATPLPQGTAMPLAEGRRHEELPRPHASFAS
jgi:hypothetical protein